MSSSRPSRSGAAAKKKNQGVLPVVQKAVAVDDKEKAEVEDAVEPTPAAIKDKDDIGASDKETL